MGGRWDCAHTFSRAVDQALAYLGPHRWLRHCGYSHFTLLTAETVPSLPPLALIHYSWHTAPLNHLYQIVGNLPQESVFSPVSQCLSVLVCSLPGRTDRRDRRLFRRLTSTCDGYIRLTVGQGRLEFCRPLNRITLGALRSKRPKSPESLISKAALASASCLATGLEQGIGSMACLPLWHQPHVLNLEASCPLQKDIIIGC